MSANEATVDSGLNTFKGFSFNELRELISEKSSALIPPMVAIFVFLILWSVASNNIVTSLGNVPGPVEVAQQFKVLVIEHQNEREKAKAFYQRQEVRNVEKLAANPNAEVKLRKYTGKPTFFDQIITSLLTVFSGFALAAIFAIPVGILCGLSKSFYQALNPLIQIFKPVSPLAWLPIVTMVVSAVYVSDDPMFEKAFITSAITVTLCSLWPTLINTAVGVASIDKDLLNVGKVLRLDWWTKVRKIVLPSAMPLIFTGLRLSLSVGWMVLIAAEMLAQNPGLGKFVWDEFQNGSSNSLGRIMVAVFVIGIIGFLLDRIMLILQRRFSYDKSIELR
ncbi:MAG: ABC transporter permease [Gammaproteobacteria bacterium]|nr:ABC transporter permease [Gammaproteobacteria bacterium]NNC96640.1 ABC transporter permease [Gammaproteobacteria bacterium]NNM13462.1 ABC transporter permease [Gammaproteobacteria bacterium]